MLPPQCTMCRQHSHAHLLPEVCLRTSQLQMGCCAPQSVHQSLGKGQAGVVFVWQRAPIQGPLTVGVMPAPTAEGLESLSACHSSHQHAVVCLCSPAAGAPPPCSLTSKQRHICNSAPVDHCENNEQVVDSQVGDGVQHAALHCASGGVSSQPATAAHTAWAACVSRHHECTPACRLLNARLECEQPARMHGSSAHKVCGQHTVLVDQQI